MKQERIDWFRNTLKLSQINANNGTVNCGRCAFKLDDYIQNGQADEIVTPASTRGANLILDPEIHANSIPASSSRDPRLFDRCQFPNLNTNDQILYDITNDELGPLLDLTYEGKPKDNSKIRLNKVSLDGSNLHDHLRYLPRRAKDNTAFGFIFLTHNENILSGHVVNFFVDSDDEIYFIDAQTNMITSTISLLTFRTDVFYLQSFPKEGFKVKQEPPMSPPVWPILKLEPVAQAAEEEEEEEVVIASSSFNVPNPEFTSDDPQVQEAIRLLKEMSSKFGYNNDLEMLERLLNRRDQKGRNAAFYLGAQNDEWMCLYITRIKVRKTTHVYSYVDCMSGAAYKWNESLLKYLYELAKKKLQLHADDYVEVVLAAMEGRRGMTLSSSSIAFLTNRKGLEPHHYNELAQRAAFYGHFELGKYYLNKVKFYNNAIKQREQKSAPSMPAESNIDYQNASTSTSSTTIVPPVQPSAPPIVPALENKKRSASALGNEDEQLKRKILRLEAIAAEQKKIIDLQKEELDELREELGVVESTRLSTL